MNKKVLSTSKAPSAIGPYVQGIETDHFIFVSGQLGLIPESGALEEGIEKQTHQAMKNVGAILSSKDAGFKNVVKSTIFVKNLDDFSTVNQIYAEYFNNEFPARSCVEVSRLPKNALVEIEVIAIL